MQVLLDHWGSTESLYDIAPAPIGDGKVDIQDLAVLAEYLEPADAGLVAHWRLDEADWDIAYDSAGQHGGILDGNPTWRPGEGLINGALQFDGIDDYLRTPFVLDPSEGPFTVCAWIRGGAPGQVILSQVDHSDWLLFGSGANLVTALTDGGRRPSAPLASDLMLSDGAWHHVCLVSDGLRRYLYIDGQEVAWDSTPSNLPSSGGLHIGAGSGLAAGSFFTGLIDDIRIYNRALRPNEIERLAY